MCTDPITAARELHQRAATAGAQAREARAARDEIIRAQIASGMTQRDLAKAVGISPGMVARIVHDGRRGPSPLASAP